MTKINKPSDFLKSGKLARKSDIAHKVEKGILFDAYYDTETTDLDKRFAEITQFGGVITDLAGNILHTADYRGKPSPYAVVSPFAWVIQRLNEERLAEGDPQYILAGRIMRFFRYASNLHEAPFSDTLLRACRVGTYKAPDGNAHRYYAYPVLDDAGKVDWNYIRIHENLKKFYYFDAQSGQWIKRNISAMAIGYNNVNADDQWLWTLLHMAGAENVFVTHLAQMGKFRLDALRVVEAAYAAGPKGEQGIMPAYKIDPLTGRKTLSFSQGDILKANTHIDSDLRHILEGVTLPDGSFPDIEQLHGAFRDAVALAGMMQYMRRQVPDILRQMERNVVWQDVIDRLTEKRGSFGNHPVMAYVDKSYPYVTGKMITLIGADQYRHNPKVALVFNLGVNPETFYFNGKKLKDLSAAEHASLIQNSRSDQNGPYKIIRTHQSPRLLDVGTGFAAGFNDGLEWPELHRRAKYLRDQDFIDRVMAGLRMAQPRLQGPEVLTLAQPEEELFTFSTLEMYDPEKGEDVQIHMVQNRIERMAQDSRRHAMLVKGFWLKAIEPDIDVLLDPADPDSFSARESAAAFMAKIKNLNKKLKENNGPLLPPADAPVEDKATATRYLLKLMFYARNHFARGEIYDIGHHFWFEDGNAHRIPHETVRKWPEWRIDRDYAAGNLRICHERLNVTSSIIDRIIEGLGYGRLLGLEINEQLDAVKFLRHHGIPALNGKDRFLTLAEAERQYQKILNNELMDDDIRAIEKRAPGVWQTFMLKHHDAQASLGSYRRYLDERKIRYPEFSLYHKIIAGVDPETGGAIHKTDYQIEPATAISLTVPDRYLDNPPLDPVSGKPVWLADLSGAFNRKSLAHALQNGSEIVLVGSSTARRKHLAKALVTDTPPPGGVRADFYKKVGARYEESNLRPPAPGTLTALIGEGPYNICDIRAVDMSAQSLKIPRRHFEGLIDPRLASYDGAVAGIVLRDDGLSVASGAVRLLEADGADLLPTGWELTTDITRVRNASVADLAAMDDDDAQRYGFPTADEMLGTVQTWFADKNIDQGAPHSRVWIIDFAAVDPRDPERGMVYFNPSKTRISAMNRPYAVTRGNIPNTP